MYRHRQGDRIQCRAGGSEFKQVYDLAELVRHDGGYGAGQNRRESRQRSGGLYR
ncbi:hypothetical protein EH203_14855 [Pectobacterium carotovorum subsp. carotovorum]|nr:hypothetical protein EH203_14855 [Pectobacterium carotovorum subsp. carotovorum]